MQRKLIAVDSHRPDVFSYASEEVGALSRGVIRVIEILSGQPRIRRLYQDYRSRNRPSDLFWDDALAALRLTLSVDSPTAQKIPAEGPLVVIANHPFGVIDGAPLLRGCTAAVRPVEVAVRVYPFA